MSRLTLTPPGLEGSHGYLVKLCPQVKVGGTSLSDAITIKFCSSDHGLSVVPTKDWQDNLSRYLASDRGSSNSCTPDSEDGHAQQRRRLSGYLKAAPQDWNSLYTIDTPDGRYLIFSS